MVDFLNPAQAVKAAVDAVNRDYITEPHLGESINSPALLLDSIRKLPPLVSMCIWRAIRVALSQSFCEGS